MVNSAFIQGKAIPPNIPLERFLPPLPPGMIQKWIENQVPKGSWVLDPFGNSPTLALELARAGYRVLVTANNPINSFMLSILAQSPSKQVFLEALSLIAQSSFGEQNLEQYIRSLYAVRCTQCNKPLEATSFLWQKDEEFPYAFIGMCPYCGKEGEQTLSLEAKATLPSLPSLGLHHARALESVVSIDDPLRPQLETALSFYLPRPLVILQLMVNKLPLLDIPDNQKDLLQALLLSACDYGNSLWSYPFTKSRRRQLTVPPIYEERNLWHALIDSVDLWADMGSAISLKAWPDHPPLSGGISLFKGRFRELDPLPEKDFIQAVVAIPPRPNQAFWTLSAVWTGWLFGKSAVSPIKSTLSRQRNDWSWHTNALYSVFELFHGNVSSETPFFMLILESEHNFVSAGTLAAASTGFELRSIAQAGESDITQCIWAGSARTPQPFDPMVFHDCGKQAGITFLTKRAEPSSYEGLHTAILAGLCKAHILGDTYGAFKDPILTELYRHTDSIILDTDYFIRFGGGTASLDSGLFWLTNPQDLDESLSDRIEKTIRDRLQGIQVVKDEEIQELVNNLFTGMLTPERELVQICLESYADPKIDETRSWILRDNESEEHRKQDIAEIISKLNDIARVLNYKMIEEDGSIKWYSEGEEAVYSLFVTTNAMISRFLYSQNPTPKKIIILPGSRANLLAVKLKHNPYFQKIIDENYQIIKFRQLRSIHENPLLTRELWDILIKDDPPELDAAQLSLF
ncbi:MAG: hypothetical protein MUO40_02910 [Anaerolineaceae bacterium]|nr:hypothetical protein [Anaerolineaceae bacterium]